MWSGSSPNGAAVRWPADERLREEQMDQPWVVNQSK